MILVKTSTTNSTIHVVLISRDDTDVAADSPGLLANDEGMEMFFLTSHHLVYTLHQT
jgi:hypothetical protein